MLRFFACAALAALAGAVGHAATVAPVSTARLSERYATADAASPLFAHHEMIRASLTRIAGKSALWRDAMSQLTRTKRRVHVFTPDQVVFVSARQGSGEHTAPVSGDPCPCRVHAWTRCWWL
jgi:hypothetical protein